MFERLFLSAILAIMPVNAFAQTTTVDIQTARLALAGVWEGKLEYLDYSAQKWFGIPVKIAIEDQGDGVTLLRKSDFDDGPTVGNVRITTVEIFDAAKKTITSGSFRKGRTAELISYSVRFEGAVRDATHWTIIEETDAKDNNRPARLRLTTVRDGDAMQTLKEVDFQDDNKVEWLQRNRTTLRLVK
jgi:hypothetical protein